MERRRARGPRATSATGEQGIRISVAGRWEFLPYGFLAISMRLDSIDDVVPSGRNRFLVFLSLSSFNSFATSTKSL
jgi:hypothetical protein